MNPNFPYPYELKAKQSCKSEKTLIWYKPELPVSLWTVLLQSCTSEKTLIWYKPEIPVSLWNVGYIYQYDDPMETQTATQIYLKRGIKVLIKRRQNKDDWINKLLTRMQMQVDMEWEWKQNWNSNNARARAGESQIWQICQVYQE